MWGEEWSTPMMAAIDQDAFAAWAAWQGFAPQPLKLDDLLGHQVGEGAASISRDDRRRSAPSRAAGAGTPGKDRRQLARAISDASTLGSDAGDDQEDLALLLGIDGASGSLDVLKAAQRSLGSARPETIVVALHLAAKHLPSDPAGAERVTSSAEVAALLRHLRHSLAHLRSARMLSRLSWTLGKLDLSSPDVDAVVAHICSVAPGTLTKFSVQDLTNTLWGLARIRTGRCTGDFSGAARPSAAGVARLAQAIVRACAQRVEELTAQCLSNSLWAVARLRLKRDVVRDFLGSCLRELGGSRELHTFTTQGIANILWALAELCQGGGTADAAWKESPVDRGISSGARLVFLLMAVEALDRVADFQPQELSMVAWACAKFYGRGGRPRRRGGGVGLGGRPEEVDALLLGIATQASHRVADLSPQSISNVSWALATCELLAPRPANTPARTFLCDAMAVAAGRLEEYAPQAVANLMWAIVRLAARGPGAAGARVQSAVAAFALVVAHHATLHLMEFSWRDLAGVAVALAHVRAQSVEAMTFMTLLVGHTDAHCPDLTPQLLLNIAQSAARLGVAPESMQPMVDTIAQCIAAQHLQLNDVDQRQWQEVVKWCPPQQLWA